VLLLKETLQNQGEHEAGHYRVDIKIVENYLGHALPDVEDIPVPHVSLDQGDQSPPSWNQLTAASEEENSSPGSELTMVNLKGPSNNVLDDNLDNEGLRSLSDYQTTPPSTTTYNDESLIYSDWAPAEHFMSSTPVQKDYPGESKDDSVVKEQVAASDLAEVPESDGQDNQQIIPNTGNDHVLSLKEVTLEDSGDNPDFSFGLSGRDIYRSLRESPAFSSATDSFRPLYVENSDAETFLRQEDHLTAYQTGGDSAAGDVDAAETVPFTASAENSVVSYEEAGVSDYRAEGVTEYNMYTVVVTEKPLDIMASNDWDDVQNDVKNEENFNEHIKRRFPSISRDTFSHFKEKFNNHLRSIE
jgi:hypothetical protein